MARSFSYQNQWLTWFFVPFILADTASFALCLWNLAFAYHGQTYELLPRIGELVRAEREWNEWASHAGDEVALQKGFQDELERSVIAAADRNANSNDRRQGYLHRANIALFTILVLTSLAGVPYVIDQAMIRAMPRDAQPIQQPPATPRPQASVPPRPSFPPNRIIREGDVPPRPPQPSGR
jgi:hypothetical protein